MFKSRWSQGGWTSRALHTGFCQAKLLSPSQFPLQGRIGIAQSEVQLKRAVKEQFYKNSGNESPGDTGWADGECSALQSQQTFPVSAIKILFISAHTRLQKGQRVVAAEPQRCDRFTPKWPERRNPAQVSLGELSRHG